MSQNISDQKAISEGTVEFEPAARNFSARKCAYRSNNAHLCALASLQTGLPAAILPASRDQAGWGHAKIIRSPDRR